MKMNMLVKDIVIVIFIIFLWSCNPASNSSAVGFLWNEEPVPSSSKIMVITDLQGEKLKDEITSNIEAMGFIVEDLNEDLLITEPKDIPGNSVVLVVEMNDNAVLISGKHGTGEDIDDWQPIRRGEGPHGSYEWGLMDVLANSIEHKSMRYN